MMDFMHSLASAVFMYAVVTRGGLAVARGMAYVARKAKVG